LAIVGLLVVVTLLRSVAAVTAGFAAAAGVALLARVPVRRLAAGVAVVSLFSAVLVGPAATNLVTPGTAVLTIWRAGDGGGGVAITGAGLVVAARFLLRAVACATFAVALAVAVPVPRLLPALGSLGVPAIVVMTVAMVERYAVVLARSAEEIYLAKLARGLAHTGVRREQAWAAAGLGELYRRSRTLADGVALAMIARGWRGRARSLRPARLGIRDGILVTCAAMVAVALLALG
jgi:energy-coupling factor transporter transmembrane protein EcfT